MKDSHREAGLPDVGPKYYMGPTYTQNWLVCLFVVVVKSGNSAEGASLT